MIFFQVREESWNVPWVILVILLPFLTGRHLQGLTLSLIFFS